MRATFLTTALMQLMRGGPTLTSEKAKSGERLQREAQLKSLSRPPKIWSASSKLKTDSDRSVDIVEFAMAKSLMRFALFSTVFIPFRASIFRVSFEVFDPSTTLVGFRMSTFAVEISLRKN